MWILVIVFALVLALWLSTSPFIWYGKGVEWKFCWPLVGSVSGALVNTYFDYWLDFYKQSKAPLTAIHFLLSPALVVRDPELVKQVMITDADSYASRGMYASDHDVYRGNLFWAGGEEWRMTRAKMTPYFSPAKIKSMIPVIESCVDSYVNRLEEECSKGPVEVDDTSMRFSVDIIVSTVFGMKPDSFTNPQAFFYNLQNELPGFTFGLRVIACFLSNNPIGKWLYDFFKVTIFRKEANVKMKYFIEKALDARLRGEGVRADIMQGFIELYLKDKDAERSVKYNSDGTRIPVFDENLITAQAMVLMYAGTDTTGHTISFALFELARDQKVQDRLRDEIADVKRKNNGKIGYEEVKQMTYLDMVISEVMRLHTVVPSVPRKCTRATRLGGLDVPVGTMFGIPIVGIHRNPDFYPDPDKFDPERFAPGTVREAGTYLPFGLGPRTCIGMRMAEMEMKLCLSKILNRFKVEISTETPSTIRKGFGPTTAPRDGIPLMFTPIAGRNQ